MLMCKGTSNRGTNTPAAASKPPSHLISPVSAGGHQHGLAPFINHLQLAIAREWCSLGVKEYHGRANSPNNTRLAV